MRTFTFDRRRFLSRLAWAAGVTLLLAGGAPARAFDAQGIDIPLPPGVTAPAQPPAHGMVVAQERIALPPALQWR
jgi:gamma-glutamyltranspeptidase/glutathione hydrolase